VYLEQLYTFGDADRDPRGRIVTVAYYALLTGEAAPLKAGTDAGAAAWMPARKHPPLAFDHDRILTYALERLANKLDYTTVGFQLLPRKFTLSQLQRVYETVLGRSLDKRNFRRKLAILDVLTPLDEWVTTGTAPAQVPASRVRNGVSDRTRPLCPYPQIAVYKGSGSVEDAANFSCRVYQADRTR